MKKFPFRVCSEMEDLREYLYSNGFEINQELAVSEGRRYYIALDAVYTGKVRAFTLSDCFIGKLPKNNDAKMHLTNQLNRLEKKYFALKSKVEKEEIKELEILINNIKGFIYG